MSLIEDYISSVPEAERKEFQRLSDIAKRLVPDYGEGVSYGMNAFTYKGKPFLSFTVTKHHLSIYPFSGKVISRLEDKLEGFDHSSGTLRFQLDKPIPLA